MDSESRPLVSDSSGHGHIELGEGELTFTEAYATMLKVFIGAGVFGMPFAFREAGLVGGILSLLFVTFFILQSMRVLIHMKTALTERHQRHFSFEDIGQMILGDVGSTAISITLVVTQLGVCIAYVIFIAQSFSHLIGPLTYREMVLIQFPFLFLLSLIRSLKTLVPASLMGSLFNLACIGITLFYAFAHRGPIEPAMLHIQTVPVFLGLATFAMEGIGNVIPVHDAMKNKEEYDGVLNLTMVTMIILYSLFGITAYLCFGSHTSDVITTNLHGAFATIVTVLLSAVLLLTYPIQLFPVSKLLDQAIGEVSGVTLKQNLGRLCVVALTCFIGFMLPHFGNMLSLVGCLFFGLLGFVYPFVMHIKGFSEELTPLTRCIDFGGLLFGAVVIVSGVIVNVSEMSKAHS